MIFNDSFVERLIFFYTQKSIPKLPKMYFLDMIVVYYLYVISKFNPMRDLCGFEGLTETRHLDENNHFENDQITAILKTFSSTKTSLCIHSPLEFLDHTSSKFNFFFFAYFLII